MDPGISSKATIVASPRQVSTEVDGESVILNLDQSVYYGLDEVGARVWELISEPRTLNEVRDQIVEIYEVDPARCESDLRTLLSDLADAGLIEVSDERNG